MSAHDWQVVGASVCGSAHERRQLPCQDAHAYQVFSGACLAVAVADGAGSAARSSEGAQFVAQTALALIDEALVHVRPTDAPTWERLFTRIFQQVYLRFAAFAEAEATPLRDFATTLTLALVADPWLVLGQVGDGLVVVDDGSGSFALPISPERGEYANETVFLITPAAADAVACVALEQPVAALVVSTDGLLRLALQLPSYAPFAPFFQPLFAFVAQTDGRPGAEADLAVWLASETVCERTDDDKTLVIAVRRPASAPSSSE